MPASSPRPPAPKTRPRNCAERFDAEGSLSALFPEIYHRRIDQALMRGGKQPQPGAGRGGHVATATARTNMVERAYREVAAQDERERGDRERLELIGAASRKPEGK